MEQLSFTPPDGPSEDQTRAQMTAIVEQLNAERRASNWTYTQLGRRAGIAPTTARSVLEGSQMPHLETFVKLASALGMRLTVAK